MPSLLSSSTSQGVCRALGTWCMILIFPDLNSTLYVCPAAPPLSPLPCPAMPCLVSFLFSIGGFLTLLDAGSVSLCLPLLLFLLSRARLMYHSIFSDPTDDEPKHRHVGSRRHRGSQFLGRLEGEPHWGRTTSLQPPAHVWETSAFLGVRLLCLSWKIATLRCLAATEVLLTDRRRRGRVRSRKR